jgi:ASC-1-like (ASCH) protein
MRQIERGEKTVHTRIGVMYGKRRTVCPGDRVTFKYASQKTAVEWHLTCEAVATMQYPTFRDALLAEGIERCVPGCGQIEKAISVCHAQHQTSDSPRMERDWGVVAIHLKPISPLQRVDANGKEKQL